MFHILIENSTPNRLVGGPWKSILPTHSSDTEASVMECGLRGGTVREALSHPDIKHLMNEKKFKFDNACKDCLRKIRGKYGKTKDSEAS